MNLKVGTILILSLSFVGCIQSDNADPLNGRQPPTVQVPPQTEKTPDGTEVLCSDLRKQDHETYLKSIQEHKNEKNRALTELQKQHSRDTANLRETIGSHQQVCQQKIDKYTADIRQYKNKSEKAKKDAAAKFNERLDSQQKNCQKKVDAYASDIDRYRQSREQEKAIDGKNIAILKKQVKQCETAKKVTDRQNFSGVLFNLNISSAQPRSLEFTEGVSSAYEFQTRLFVGKKGAIKAIRPVGNLPKGLTIKAVSGKPGFWVIKWKPPVNLEVGNDLIYRRIELEPTIDNRKLSKSDKNLIASEDLTTKILLVVRRTKVKPQIELTEIPDRVAKGEKIKFSIAVTDASATEDNPPLVHIVFGGNPAGTTYRQLINGASLITANSKLIPEFQNGAWIFHYVLNTAIVDIDPELKAMVEKSKKQLEIQFQVIAQSQVNGQSIRTQNKLISMEVGEK